MRKFTQFLHSYKADAVATPVLGGIGIRPDLAQGSPVWRKKMAAGAGA